MLAILGQQGNGIDAGTIVMELPLQPSVFGGENKIPVTACAAVVAPVRDRRIGGEGCIQSYIGLVHVTEILSPGIHLVLSRRVPRHLATERIGFILPTVGATSHFCFEVFGLFFPAFTLKI